MSDTERVEGVNHGSLTAALNAKMGKRRGPINKKATAFTPDKRTLICAMLQKGLSFDNAARIAKTLPTSLNHLRAQAVQFLMEWEPGEELPWDAIFYLQMEEARGRFALRTLDKFETAMDKDPRVAMAYLQLIGRELPAEYGPRQVIKNEHEQVMKVMFVEKDGTEWQRGQVQATVEDETLALPPGPAPQSEGNEIIDAELMSSESEDDNDF